MIPCGANKANGQLGSVTVSTVRGWGLLHVQRLLLLLLHERTLVLHTPLVRTHTPALAPHPTVAPHLAPSLG